MRHARSALRSDGRYPPRARAAAAAAVVCLTAVALFASAGASAAASPTKVTVTIARSRIRFTPAYVPAGPVEFTIANRTRSARDFGVGSTRTATIMAGHSAILHATLAGRGERTFSSVATAGGQGAEHPAPFTGALYLYAPCTDPSSTTVDVSIDKAAGGLTLAPTTVPCGTVTFDVTDVDTPGTSLLVSLVVPPVSAVTDQLDPGQTATMTVRFGAKAVVHCDAVQDDSGGDSLVVGYGSLTLS